MNKNYAQELILDCYGCNLKILKSKAEIRDFVNQLCRLIKMKKYGSVIIKRFGEKTPFGEGYSFLQFIETSSITGHFLEINGKAYFNIFSCQPFDAKKAETFTRDFFKAKRIKKRVLIRH